MNANRFDRRMRRVTELNWSQNSIETYSNSTSFFAHLTTQIEGKKIGYYNFFKLFSLNYFKSPLFLFHSKIVLFFSFLIRKQSKLANCIENAGKLI